MFAGHIGVAMAVARVEPQVNAGYFFAASLLLDILLWGFVLVGWESVKIPADFAQTHLAEFDFPYSHSLLAVAIWSALAAATAYICLPLPGAARGKAAMLVAAVVFSHWLLDALVHSPGLPLAGATSTRIGLGLWQNLPVALALEAALAIIGIYLFLGSRPVGGKPRALAVLGVATLVFTVGGMTLAPPPPSAAAMAASSLVTLAAICALAWWFGRKSRLAGDT